MYGPCTVHQIKPANPTLPVTTTPTFPVKSSLKSEINNMLDLKVQSSKHI